MNRKEYLCNIPVEKRISWMGKYNVQSCDFSEYKLRAEKCSFHVGRRRD